MIFVYEVKLKGKCSVCCKNIEELIDWLTFLSVEGETKIEITTTEISQEYYDTLPEFEGY